MSKNSLRMTTEQYQAIVARQVKYSQAIEAAKPLESPAPVVTAISLEMPWPPSANNYVRHASQHYMTAAAKDWREQVINLCRLQKIQPIVGRIHVHLTLQPPNKRRVDIDNRIKPALDALQHGGCYADDEAIDKLTVIRGPVVKNGACRVQLLLAQ